MTLWYQENLELYQGYSSRQPGQGWCTMAVLLVNPKTYLAASLIDSLSSHIAQCAGNTFFGCASSTGVD